MSAAEPAGPVAGPPAAAVIHLNRKRRRRGDAAATMLEPTREQQLAETIESYFQRAQGRTLTDEETAAAFLITLVAVSDMVDGALAQNLLGEEQHRHLRAHLDGMRRAPDLLS